MEEIENGGEEFMANWAKYLVRRKSLFVPAAIIDDKELSPQAKMLFIIINSYCKPKGVFYGRNDLLIEKLGLMELW